MTNTIQIPRHDRLTCIRVVPWDGSDGQVEAIFDLYTAAFGEPPGHDHAAIQAGLRQKEQSVWLAREATYGGQNTYHGFLAALTTEWHAGRRLEIDLVGVSPSVQGRGIGGALLHAALAEASASTARETRALIREGNAGSERLFARAGFSPGKDWLELMLTSAQPRQGDGQPGSRGAMGQGLPAAAGVIRSPRCDYGLIMIEEAGRQSGYVELLKVWTVGYSGVWVEAVDDGARLTTGALTDLTSQTRCWAQERDARRIGMLVKTSDSALLEAMRSSGWESAGVYRWFSLPLRGAGERW